MSTHRLFSSPSFFFLLLAGVAASAYSQQLPEGPGKEVTQKICASCHAPTIVVDKGHTKDEWEQVVSDMVAKGATGTDEEFGQIVDYLAKNFPKEAVKKVAINKASPDELRAGLEITAKDADAIVSYRKQNGDFKSIDDLKKVPGIDAAKLDAKKDRLVF